MTIAHIKIQKKIRTNHQGNKCTQQNYWLQGQCLNITFFILVANKQKMKLNKTLLNKKKNTEESVGTECI